MGLDANIDHSGVLNSSVQPWLTLWQMFELCSHDIESATQVVDNTIKKQSNDKWWQIDKITGLIETFALSMYSMS